MKPLTAYVTFGVGSATFGIEATQVVELARGVEVTPVPLGPKAVRGFINLRGQIVTAIDLRVPAPKDPSMADA